MQGRRRIGGSRGQMRTLITILNAMLPDARPFDPQLYHT